MLKSRGSRIWVTKVLISTVLDVFLACALAALFGTRDFWITMLVILGFLWIAPWLLRINSTLSKLIQFFVQRGRFRRDLVHAFRKAKLPLLSQTDFNEPADLYFAEVASDDSLPKEARLFSSRTLGELTMVPKYSLVDSIIFNANIDAALAEYFDQLRRDGMDSRVREAGNGISLDKVDRQAR